MAVVAGTTPANLPTLYEYYSANGITQGLSDNQPYFTLNNKNITLYSGAFHYFRMHPDYWRDRLRKMRAAGLNAVETYVPWNLHEPEPGVYDFGDGGTDMQDFLDVEKFLKTAKEEDLLVLVRPGPYICAEWEFGGFPSWILRNTTTVRSSKDQNYISYITRWFNVLLPILALFQFQKGGPIVGFQIENEFGSLRTADADYLATIKNLMINNGIIELLYTADNPMMTTGNIPGVFQTGNVGDMSEIVDGLKVISDRQPGKPSMVMETYTGWFDHWGDTHHTTSAVDFLMLLFAIVQFPSSVNMYMFTGSTSFGFLNGANDESARTDNSGLEIDTTSYDYDSPITEYGALTDKYSAIKILVLTANPVKTKIPDPPDVKHPVQYPSIELTEQILLNDIIEKEEKIQIENIIPMELLPINNDSGQSFGYLVYRKSNVDLPKNAVLKIVGYVRDTVLVLVNGKLISPTPLKKEDIDGFGFWRLQNSTLELTKDSLKNATLDLVVENFGRNGYGKLEQFHQHKGLTDDVYIDDNKITDWQAVPLQFKSSWNKNLGNWGPIKATKNTPALYRFVLNIKDNPEDTFVDLRNWTKGITIVNGFVLGRHFFIGPQQALYLPAPFLKSGDNEIVVFEHYSAPHELRFSKTPIYETL